MAAELARKLVAVMFTDMVGYTALLLSDEGDAVEKRSAYWAAIESAHAAHGGTIVQRLGDGSMSMFPSALAAIEAGVEVQRRLGGAGVPVRVGVHVGDVVVEEERLTGVAVNVASRIESFSVPGAVLLSDSAREQVANRAELPLTDLGAFKLKGVGRPVVLYAVDVVGVVVPDPRELEGKGDRFSHLPGSVPERTSSILGRAADVEAVAALLQTDRLVTITGPGGIGKTTLAQEVGRGAEARFPDGVAFVALDQVREATEVIPFLADALGVKEAEDRSWIDGIVALIGSGRSLLLLDNLEQVVAAAAEIAVLVERCPGLRILATSRTPLHLRAEQEYPLAPLGLPAKAAGDDDDLRAAPAVSLFVERARTARGGFDLDADNACNGGRDLSSPRRASAGPRAGCRSTAGPHAGGPAEAAQPRARRPHHGRARPSGATADVEGDDRLEPLTAQRVGATAVPPHGGLRRWRDPVRRRGRVLRTRRRRPRRPRVVARQGARADERRPLPDAADARRVRRASG